MARLHSVRPNLRWLLWVCAFLAFLSVGRPDERPTGSDAPSTVRERAIAAPEPAVSLPEQLSTEAIDPSSFDPFVGLQPPSQPLPVPPTPFVLVGPLPPPPAPALNYRYLGQMLDPAGQRVVYLSKGDAAAVPVSIGTQIPEGYVVEAIDDGGVRLYAAMFDSRVVIPISPAQDSVPR